MWKMVLLLIAIKGPGFLRRNIHNPELVGWFPVPQQCKEVTFYECLVEWSLFFFIVLEEDVSVLFFMLVYRIRIVKTG